MNIPSIGLVSGVVFPSFYNLFSVWSSPDERATLMSAVMSGIVVANVINLPVRTTIFSFLFFFLIVRLNQQICIFIMNRLLEDYVQLELMVVSVV